MALTMLLTMALPAAAANRFEDVERADWYYAAVTTMANEGVVSGYPDGTFRPNDTLTQGECLTLVLQAAGSGKQTSAGAHWAEGYLTYGKQQGVIAAGETVALDEPVTRGTAARWLVKALGLELKTEDNPFTDTTDIYAVSLYHAGLAAGYETENGLQFRPEGTLTRAEMCSLLFQKFTQGKFQYGSHWIPIAENLNRNPYVAKNFRNHNNFLSYQGMDTEVGIDVSYYQGDVDWQQVKDSGVSFVIIRLGYRGYGSGKLVIDPKFKEYIDGASAVGLKIGIYFFSQAISTEEAEEEAQLVLENIRGYRIDYPVVFDWEIIGVSTARTDSMTADEVTACATQFCDTVAAAGYTPAVYFTKYLGYRRYHLGALADYDFWFAEYSSQPSCYYEFQIWQYSDSANIPGISGRVDLNISFKKYGETA